jgi:NADPH2:quinone reductase
MRAAWYERTGRAPDVLVVGQADTPRPGSGEVLVAVAFSGINPHDTKRRSGWTGEPMTAPRIIPHADGAGVIAAVGPDVPATRVGERVWIFRADAVRPGSGSAAEYAVVPSTHAVALPDSVPFEIGACLGVPGLTAFAAVFTDGPVEGRTILVQGGAGAVAGYAVQLAVLGGARVIATASSAEKAAIARALGAEAVVNYHTEDVARRVLALSGGVDRVIEVDFGTNIATDIALLRPHGVIASYSSSRVREPVLPYYGLARKDASIRFIQGMLLTEECRQRGAAHLTALAEAGRLRHPDRHIFPLARIAEAHELLESGAVPGKVLVSVP